jgi:hypothetical protein
VIAVARYLLAEHLRSRRIAAPLLLLAVGVVVLYAQPPNPVLSTAGVVAGFVFVVALWLGVSLLNSQGDAERAIFAVAAGPLDFALGRILALVASDAAVAVAAVAFPTLTGRFERAPTVAELALILLGTFAAALAGGAVAALFSRPFVRSRLVAVMGLTATAVLTVPLGISPALATARALDVDNSADAATRLEPTLIGIAAFALASLTACALLWRRRE